MGGCQLYYETSGSGLPLLLIHGLGSDHTTWAEIGPLLARHFQLIAPDLRGFGFSDRPKGEYTPEVWASDLARLLQALNIPSAFVLGHSMGGIVALRLALDFPDGVRALVISDSSSECNQRARDLWLEVAALVESEGVAALTKTVESRFSPEYVAQHPEAVARANPDSSGLSSDPVVYAAACRSVADLYERPLTPLLGGIHCPTLVLAGEQDSVTPPEAALIIQRHIPDAVLIVFPGRGHSLYHEAPAEYPEAVVAFLLAHAM